MRPVFVFVVLFVSALLGFTRTQADDSASAPAEINWMLESSAAAPEVATPPVGACASGRCLVPATTLQRGQPIRNAGRLILRARPVQRIVAARPLRRVGAAIVRAKPLRRVARAVGWLFCR